MQHTRFHISLTLEGIFFVMSFFITFQTFSIRFKSRLFSGQSSDGTFLVEAFGAFNNSMCISLMIYTFRGPIYLMRNKTLQGQLM